MPDPTSLKDELLGSALTTAEQIGTAVVAQMATNSSSAAVAAAQHGVQTVKQHNPELSPFIDGAIETAEAYAEHLPIIGPFLAALFARLDGVPVTTINLPPSAISEQPAT